MTPATPQPRHPLELLAREWEHAANFEAINIEEVCAFRRCARELRDLMTQMESQESTLRAQAEAEGAWRARMNHACLRLDMRARSAASVGHARQAEIWTAAGDIVSEEYRAALAQAGGTP